MRAFSGLAVKAKPAAQTIRDDAVDDVQAKAGASEVPPRGEERVEGLTPDIRAHAAAVVGEGDLDVIGPGGAHLDLDGSRLMIGIGMRDGIEEQIGEHLSDRSGVAVHREIGLALDV